MSCGVLLLNVGTPKDHSYWSVKSYLDQFLMDERIIDIPYIFRYPLVKFLITPVRAHSSAKKYREIWQSDGSRLFTISQQQTAFLQKYLGKDFEIHFAFGYGEPSIDKKLQLLINKGLKQIILVPLFPQYSSAATGAVLQAAFSHLKNQWHIPSIKTLPEFFSEEFFIKSQARVIQNNLSKKEHLILSFHGLPKKHIVKAHKDIPCSQHMVCPKDQAQTSCYRAQCFQTARLIAQELELKNHQFSVCFQSRLGNREWIKPYLEETLISLRQAGIKDVAIACPAFVTDCLETLHEIGIEAKAYWQNLSGRNLRLIPCLNVDEMWLSGLGEKIRKLSDTR